MPTPASLPTRKLGQNGPEITALGLGLMGLSIAYGKPGFVPLIPVKHTHTHTQY